MKLFTEDDFESQFYCGSYTPKFICEKAADIANAKFNEWLSKGKVVYGEKDSVRGCWAFDEQPATADTHKGILVCIEPLEKDSAEKIIADMVFAKEMNEKFGHQTIFDSFFDRARKLLSAQAEGKEI